MEQFFYTETMTVMNADADFRSLLKPSALLRYVEQISTDHARAFGMDDQFFKERGVTFLVGKQALKFDRVPQRAETLTLTSRAQVSKHGSVKRITTLTDAEGKEVAMVDCRWIVASLAEGRILREPGWTVENFWNDTVEDELPLQLHKCKDGLTSAGEWTARYSQCDLNGHLNNAFYLDLVCDALPQQWPLQILPGWQSSAHPPCRCRSLCRSELPEWTWAACRACPAATTRCGSACRQQMPAADLL